MQPEITPDTSTLVAMAGLVAFFVCIVFLWIIAFRHGGADRMVTTTNPDDPADGAPVRIVEVPIAGAVDGGPLLGGRVMRIADPAKRRTVRKLIAPTAPPTPPVPPASPASPAPASIPDETPPADIEQQQTQSLPIVPAARSMRPVRRPVNLGGSWLMAHAAPPETLPRDCWN